MAYKELVRAWVGEDRELIDQIAGACLSCAADIEAEAADTPNHAARLTWAHKVEKDPRVKAQKFLTAVCENATIAAALPNAADADVKFVVASNIDAIAGA